MNDTETEISNKPPFSECPQCRSSRVEVTPAGFSSGKSSLLAGIRRLPGGSRPGVLPGGHYRIKCRDCGYTGIILLR
ncbi:hypothetical protein [Succinimonas amylolytica]|uniref:hypothetical protein n=1 Tax=Succinimonas amylolytica TaxID=83769 RepID=UPI00035C3550|nr:hypothetical protein [Succinimonas amylolytica]